MNEITYEEIVPNENIKYEEIHLHSNPYMGCDIKSGKIIKGGNINRCRIVLKENDDVFFDEEKFWVNDNNRGIISGDDGSKWFFDTEGEALIYITKGNMSKIEHILMKIKDNGFKNLTSEEQEFFKKYNKKKNKKK